jgi:hypothetical protein
MRRRHHRATARHVPAATLLVAVLATACSLSGAGSASGAISDSTAEPNWQVVVESPGADHAGEVVITGGVIYVAGSVPGSSSSVPSLLRLPLGSSTWARTTAAVTGRAFDIARGPSGSLYTAGYRVGAVLTTGASVIKWSKNGVALWSRAYDGPVSGNGNATDVAADGAGNVVMCASVPGTYASDWAVVSWSPSGKRRWVWRYSGSGHAGDAPEEIAIDKAGNVYVTGTAVLTGGVFASCTAKLSPGGKKLWVKTYKGPDGAGAWSAAIVRRKAGGMYVGGHTLRADGSRDALVLRYSATGGRTVLPPYSIGDAGTSVGVNDLAVTTSGVITAVGAYSSSGLADQILCSWKPDETPGVAYMWGTTYSDSLKQVVADPFGGVCTIGTFAYGGDGDTRIVTRRTSLGQGAFWEYLWDGPRVAYHSATGVASSGSWVVTAGYCNSTDTGDDQFIQVWKY